MSAQLPTGKTSSLLKKNQKYINLTASELKNSPQWIQCSGETRVIRDKNRPDFVYSGSFYARVDDKGHVNLINIVDLEKYLRGVVPSEVYSGWPMETLKTQAVAARTYAVYHLARSKKWEEPSGMSMTPLPIKLIQVYLFQIKELINL